VLVADAMTRRPVTVTPDATVAAARSAMRRGRFRHLPVLAAARARPNAGALRRGSDVRDV